MPVPHHRQRQENSQAIAKMYWRLVQKKALRLRHANARARLDYRDRCLRRCDLDDKVLHQRLAALSTVAIFLASSASKLINGVTIPVDGGYLEGVEENRSEELTQTSGSS
jgi:hypothetical protein